MERSSVWPLRMARVAVYTVVATVLSTLPAFKVAGAEGVSITLGAVAPVVLAGALPVGEAVSAALAAGILATVIPPPGVFGPLSPLPMVVATAAASLAYRYGRRGVLAAVAIHLAFLILFAVLGGEEFLVHYPHYPWFHVLGMCIALLMGDFGSGTLLLIPPAVEGVLVDHAVGCAIAQIYFPLVAGFSIPPSIWRAVAWVYPVERGILIAVAYAVLVAMRRLGVSRR